MQTFISCDWGTSALRVRLVDANTLNVIAQTESLQGISATFESWKNDSRNENGLLIFYQSALNKEIERLEQKVNHSLNDVPLIISGMASSSIGMIELRYRKIPFDVDADDLNIKVIEASDGFRHQIILISGIRTEDDVMRGEETLLVGCIDENIREEQLFIFPGTHSKQVVVKDGIVVDFKTYMTGEFFELLSKKSILSNDVAEGNFSESGLESFKKGVKDSLHSNLLHSSFLVRTNHLFDKLSKQENYFYLSGLLIGAELKEAMKNHENIILVSEPPLSKLYETAFEILKEKNSFLKVKNASEAVLKGQIRVCNKLFRTSNIHKN